MRECAGPVGTKKKLQGWLPSGHEEKREGVAEQTKRLGTGNVGENVKECMKKCWMSVERRGAHATCGSKLPCQIDHW